jgi:ABC-type Zn uptake system ZnuABC Zn-binding protein ZnuA
MSSFQNRAQLLKHRLIISAQKSFIECHIVCRFKRASRKRLCVMAYFYLYNSLVSSIGQNKFIFLSLLPVIHLAHFFTVNPKKIPDRSQSRVAL